MLTRVVKALVATISALVAIVVLLYATGVKIGDEGVCQKRSGGRSAIARR